MAGSGSNYEEVIDWVTLSERNNRRHRRGGAAKEKQLRLAMVENKTLTVPIGGSVLPHSEMRTEGVVAVKATPYLSIMIPQKPAVAALSSRAMRDATQPRERQSRRHPSSDGRASSPRAAAAAHASTAAASGGRASSSMWQSQLDSHIAPAHAAAPAVRSSRRDRRILSRLASGHIRDVGDLPLPALFD